MVRLYILISFLTSINFLFANSITIINESVEIDWKNNLDIYQPTLDYNVIIPNFKGAIYPNEHPFTPSYSRVFAVTGQGHITAKVSSEIYEDIEAVNKSFDLLHSELDIKQEIINSREKYKGGIKFNTIIKTADGRYKKLISFNLLITFEPKIDLAPISFRGSPFKTTSALNSGRWFKIATDKTDVYKITADYFSNNFNVSASSINPKNVKIYSNGGGTLPEKNSADRIDDIEEIAIAFKGNDNNILENGEYFLFFAESPNYSSFDTINSKFNFTANHYSFNNHYFINIDGAPGKRIETENNTVNPDRFSNEYYDVQRYEPEMYNQLDFRQDAHGSGQRWFGDKFVTNLKKSFSNEFELNNYVTDKEINWYAELMSVTFSGSSKFKLQVDNDIDESSYASVIANTSHQNISGFVRLRKGNFIATSPNLSGISLEFSPSTAESTGFLDYIQIEGYKNLIFNSNDKSRYFRDIADQVSQTTEYTLKSTNNSIDVWDVSNKFNIKELNSRANPDGIKFNLSGQLINEFVALDGDNIDLFPAAVGEVNNQNLHAISNTDMLVVYHPDFKNVADRFVDYRESQDQFNCASASIDEVYNEFSGGSVDASGLRDFCKMLYDRDTSFKYLLIIGDGTFDMRHIKDDVVDQNFICTYQTVESNVSILSFPSDDYFGLLNDNEGEDLKGGLEISIGRFPIQKEQEGIDMLNKIIAYESDAKINGDWKQRIMMLGDDEDGNTHFDQIEGVCQDITDNYPDFEINKLHFDAFEQESNSAGNRYPEVNERINNNYTKGQFIINYIGHGGNRGLAQERVISIPEILTWDRKNGFPIFITATCSFSSYDDPDFTSAGERSILKANGGAVALMSTVRLVYSNYNFTLIQEIFETLLEPKANNAYRRIGEVYVSSKDDLSVNTLENARKFELFGDPSMIIALPKYDIYTSTINDRDVTTGIDTIGALQKVKVNGFIGDNEQIKSDFNGELFIKVFDKPITLKTRGQDPDSDIEEFEVQNTVLYQGRVSVTSGQFTYEFIVPRDINYSYGPGKIIHYAKSANGEDASGSQDEIIIGGTAKNPITDDQPPTVQIFLDDEAFVSGNSVANNPTLLVDLADDFGINITGTSIGHDISSIIDGDTKSTKVLNEFYTAKLDQQAQGRVEYQLKDIEAGLHAVKVQAWDIANNKGESSVEFLVVDKEDYSLERIYNYPNPFTTNTNFQFEHDLPSSALDVQIDIYTISGNRVKTIQESVVSEGKLVRNIHWDGLDEFGDDLARGVYLYKINVRSDNNGLSTSFSGESDFERLVILK